MKQKLQALGAALMLCATPLFAHDFEVNGIYYNIMSAEDKTVEVTFSGDSSGAVENEYSGSVIIPETVIYNEKSYSVTSIGESAFSTCVDLTSVVIGNSVTSIGIGAFYYCSSLTSVKIPNSVTSIGESAFSFCSVLTSVEIGNSVTCIGKDAFQGCTSLTSVLIPSSVTSIGESAFSRCSALESIIVDEENTVYDSRQGCNAIIETSSNTLVHSCQSTIIPNSVTSIGAFAFRDCSGLTSVEIPNSVTSIGDYAFYDCSDLTSVVIPNSVTSIGDYAFYNCSDLTSVKIGNSVTSIGDYAFSGCSSLTSVVIPNSVTSIWDSAFRGCSSLTSVEIPNSVTSIGMYAFDNCSSLTSVKIGNSVTSIGTFAFSDCYDLESIIVDEENSVYDSREGCNAVIETSSNTLVAGCKSTIIPNSVTSIGDLAFYSCEGLTSVVIPNSVTSIGVSAFSLCSSLTSVEIPNSVTSIGEYVFSDCSGLTFIAVAADNPIYDSRNNCNAIIETQTNTLIAGCCKTTIPNSVTSIGDYAFDCCSSLTSVEIPNSVTSIGDCAFRYCYNLTSVVIPNSVTSIGEYAFSKCYGLTSITSYISADKLFEIESDVFEDIDKMKCTLYVPYGAQETYDATAGWSEFTNIVEMSAFNLTVSSAGYATLYLDYAAEIPDGVEVYTASEIEGDRLMMELVEGDVLPANTGVLIKASAGTYTFNYTDTEVPAIADNLFSGSAFAEYIDVPSNKTAFVLSAVNGNNVGMYLAKLTDGQFLNNANKAYLLLSKDKLGISDEEVDTSIGGMQLSLRFDFNGSTGIDGVQTETSAQGTIYDLYGRKLQSAPTKGFYIINGKKVLVK